jgi:hypothetical protein
MEGLLEESLDVPVNQTDDADTKRRARFSGDGLNLAICGRKTGKHKDRDEGGRATHDVLRDRRSCWQHIKRRSAGRKWSITRLSQDPQFAPAGTLSE